MTIAYVDTNIFIRFFVNDDPDKHTRSKNLFAQARDGKIKLIAPHTVIDEVVFVLQSAQLYKRTRKEIAALLIPLLNLRGIQVHQRDAILKALTLYADSNIDFADCVTAALAQRGTTNNVYSFDADFDDTEGVTRLEPEAHPISNL